MKVPGLRLGCALYSLYDCKVLGQKAHGQRNATRREINHLLHSGGAIARGANISGPSDHKHILLEFKFYLKMAVFWGVAP
jgi:hypothetical protein